MDGALGTKLSMNWKSSVSWKMIIAKISDTREYLPHTNTTKLGQSISLRAKKPFTQNILIWICYSIDTRKYQGKGTEQVPFRDNFYYVKIHCDRAVSMGGNLGQSKGSRKASTKKCLL